MHLEVTLDDGRIIFRQSDYRAKKDHESSIIFGCTWALLLPIALYIDRESLSYLWVLSLCASLWWCYGVFVKKSLPLKEIRYFEIDTVRKQLRIPRPTPYHVETHEVIDINSIEKFLIEDLHSDENGSALHAAVSSLRTSAPTKIHLLADIRFSSNDVARIKKWLTSLCDSYRHL